MKNLKKMAAVIMPMLFLGIAMISCDEDETPGLAPGVSVDVINRFGAEDQTGMQGDSIIVLGRNLDKITSVTFVDGSRNIEVPFTTNGPAFRLYFNVPFFGEDDVEFGMKKLILTSSDGDTFEYDFELLQTFPVVANAIEVPGGFEEVLFTDFDGEGLRGDGDAYFCFGDFDEAETGVRQKEQYLDGGNYYQIRYDPNKTQGFVGCSQSALDAEAVTSQFDPEKVSIVFSANPNGGIGTAFEITLRNQANAPFTSRFVLENEGWQDYQLKLSDFGEGFDASNVDGAKIDPSSIREVALTIGVSASAAASPAQVLVDNIRFHIDPSTIPAPERIAVPLGFNSINYTDFDGGGVRPEAANENWSCFGDVDADNSGIFDKGGYVGGGNFHQVAWNGDTADGTVGCEANALPQRVITSQTDAAKASVVFATNGTVGTAFDVVMTDQASNPFTTRIVFEESGWKEYSVKLSDFVAGLDPTSEEENTENINPSQIANISFRINEAASADVVPSVVQIDDIRFYIDTTPSAGPSEVLITDFDGGGFEQAQGDAWSCFGAVSASPVSDVDGIDGNYYTVDWTGNTDPTFGGCQSGRPLPANGITQGDASKVFVVMDADPMGTVGTIMEVVFRDNDTSNSPDGQPFTQRFKFDEDGWQEVRIPLSEFGVGFSPDNQSRDIVPGDISRVQVSIAQFSGISPSRVRFDNIRLVTE